MANSGVDEVNQAVLCLADDGVRDGSKVDLEAVIYGIREQLVPVPPCHRTLRLQSDVGQASKFLIDVLGLE